MKAVSIKQPFASLIGLNIKPIENRTWKTHFRGKVYIHASGQYMNPDFLDEYINTERYLDMCKKLRALGVEERTAEYLKKQPLSAIIGEVEIIDCVVNHPSIWADKTEVIGKTIDGEILYAGKPIYNWVLANPVLYDKPILNVKGKLSFWEFDIDIVECIGCSQKFNYEEMKQDDSEENFCTECWEVLSPIMAQEAKECKESESNEIC